MKILAIGHASYDITFPIDRFPKENTKMRLTNHVNCGGGPASNAAYLLALWGEMVSFSGVVGNDFYGNKIKNEMLEVGIDITYLEMDNNVDTSLSFIMANLQSGSRTILTAKQGNKKSLSVVPDGLFDVILVDGEEPEISKKILKRHENAIKIIDAGSVRKQTLDLCPLVDYLVCSKNFAEDFCNITYDGKIDTLIQMYEQLEGQFHNIIVITLEADGCFSKFENDYKIIPSIKVKAVDTTGAGDIFHGAFTYFISHGYSLERSCYFANITGALSTLKIGGRHSMPALNEVMEYSSDVI